MRHCLFIYLALFMLLLGACASRGNSGGKGGTGGSPGNFKDSGSGDAGVSREDAAVAKSEKCGNGTKDPGEECDDGNTNDEDGCTQLCGYTCKENADCSQSDPCNSGETCDPAKHTCTPGTVKKEDGETCGDNAACFQGKCHDIECGNGITQKDEECDDGDKKEFNGCNSECRFSCASDDETRNCVNDCDLSSTCDDETHACKPGEPLPDDTLCLQGNGYCRDGQCVASTCGDGLVEPNEECDLGAENGGAECSATCTASVCGNGKIEGKEECDDGNTDIYDGCNAKCRADVVFRLNRLAILTEDAPEYCAFANNKNKGNAMRNLFPEGSTMLDTMTGLLNGMFNDGGVNVLLHITDLDSAAADKPDPIIGIGISVGDVAADWASQTDKLDFPVTVNQQFLDAQGMPVMLLSSELADKGGGIMECRTTKPGKAGFTEPGGGMDFTLYQAMSVLEVDAPRSQPSPPPTLAADLKLPETTGRDADTAPQGRLCGAMKAESFASIGLPGVLAVPCDMFNYTPCDSLFDPNQWLDTTKGECDSVLTLLQGGCGTILNPIGEPDADTDGDGTNDAYSVVVAQSSKRVKVVGITPEPDAGVDAGP